MVVPTVHEFPAGGPAVLVHGGAWAIPEALRAAHAGGCRTAAATGLAALVAGADALAAAVDAVAVLERDPVFDAGVGSFLNREGHVEMDAAVMRGHDLAFGGVAAVRRAASAVRLALRLLEEDHVAFLVGEGADRFGEEMGEPMVDPARLVVARERARHERCRAVGPDALEAMFGDTVGAIVIDRAGSVAAAGSTGGTPFKRPGRVGDTPLPGCGLYADDRFGAAAATGHGESILRVTLSRRALDELREGRAATPAAAVERALRALARLVDGRAGLLVATREGLAVGHTTAAMAFGYASESGPEPIGRVSSIDRDA